ncbi:methylisocitrate lyase [Salinisphaera sp. USBA-960]|uniref:methylisocitrate lyase n=1 Tax=Salinisphaera orenii TaxID=856731 RepID=UPI000DBE1401|nr:methylisocitrate lyase [Salifodinibacter halophilus]NNC25586.1 methylisocitrate lyase [Salifodinibacter halophilus]
MHTTARFADALAAESPLQIAGAINAYAAILAENAGFRALYVSGGGVANWSYGLPDLGMTTRDDVLEDVRRITDVTSCPLLVDIDTGWGQALNIARTIHTMENAGAACVHIEDQIGTKRCGHRPGKALVSADEMVDRLKAAVDARDSLGIMARTDAIAVEGTEAALERAARYVEAGADYLFVEAAPDPSIYRQFAELGVPVLANMTEFGRSPLVTTDELAANDVSMVLYPLSAARAMAAAADTVYREIRSQGTQTHVVEQMQTRDALYQHLNYAAYEQRIDHLFNKQQHVDDQTD